MIVDAHCHAGSGDGFTGPWDSWAPIEPYLRRARRAGIELTIVFPAFNSNYRLANQRLARIVAAHPGRLVGFAMLNPRSDAGQVESIVAEALDLGLRGIKVHGHDALPGDEVMSAAAAVGLPMLVDVVGRIDAAVRLATDYPEVPLIIPHLGAFRDDWHAQHRLIGVLNDYPNLYADTSGVRYWDVLARAARVAPDKLIFGSDGPFLHPGVELAKVQLLRLSPEQRSMVCGGTILWLLQRGGRGAPDRRGLDVSPRPSTRMLPRQGRPERIVATPTR